LKLDVGDPTAPDVQVLDDLALGLRIASGGPVYTVPYAGTSEAVQLAPGAKKMSLGRYPPAWMILGADPDRIFFRDRATGRHYIIPRRRPPDSEEWGQILGRVTFDHENPAAVLLMAIGQEAHAMIVRPQMPTFLLGPMPYGLYRLDVSAGQFDLIGLDVIPLTQPDVNLSDVRLDQTLDFIYRRGLAFQEAQNFELAKFNFELYLSLYSAGPARDLARSAIVVALAAQQQWEEMVSFYQRAGPETRWTRDAVEQILDHAPRLADRLDLARKLLQFPLPHPRRAALLFYLYKFSRDPAFRSLDAVRYLPPVYRRFFESFDRIHS